MEIAALIMSIISCLGTIISTIVAIASLRKVGVVEKKLNQFTQIGVVNGTSVINNEGNIDVH